jgi:hypothetical protein
LILSKDLDSFDVKGQWYDMALDFAQEMHEDSMKRKLRNANGIPPDEDTERENFRKTFQGAKAEVAVHKVTGLPWHRTVGNFGDKKTIPDIGEDIQVRSRAFGKGLIHRLGDDPNQKFVLVWVDGNRVTVVGWMWGWECRERGSWVDPQERGYPVWQVPYVKLRKISTITEGSHESGKRVGGIHQEAPIRKS